YSFLSCLHLRVFVVFRQGVRPARFGHAGAGGQRSVTPQLALAAVQLVAGFPDPVIEVADLTAQAAPLVFVFFAIECALFVLNVAVQGIDALLGLVHAVGGAVPLQEAAFQFDRAAVVVAAALPAHPFPVVGCAIFAYAVAVPAPPGGVIGYDTDLGAGFVVILNIISVLAIAAIHDAALIPIGGQAFFFGHAGAAGQGHHRGKQAQTRAMFERSEHGGNSAGILVARLCYRL